MLVSGFNQLKSDSALLKSKDGKSSKGESKSTFEEALGRAKSDKADAKVNTGDKSQSQERSQSDSQAKSESQSQSERQPQSQAQAKTQDANKQDMKPQAKAPSPGQQTNRKAQAEDLGGAGMPAVPAPALGGTPVNDRLMNAPQVNPALINKGPMTPNADEGVDSLTRRVVWTDFLRKMKDNLDVSAEDMLDAFSSLSPEDLAKPPQQTMDKVVMALGLDGSQAQLARQYFSDLIQKTKSKSLGDELNASQKQISLTLMSQREMDRKALDRSLDMMNRNWFKNQAPAHPIANHKEIPQKNENADDQISATDEKAAAESFLSKIGQTGEEQPSIPSTVVPPMGNLATTPALSPMNAASTAAAPQAPNAAAMNKLVAKMQAAGKLKVDNAKAESEAIDRVVKNWTAPQAPMKNSAALNAMNQQAPVAQAQAMPEAMVATPTAPAAPSVPMNSMKNLLGLGGDSSKDSSDEQADMSSDASHIGALNADSRTLSANAKTGDFQTQMTQAPQGGPAPMTVPDLVKQAQIMVREGGGEMKVTMHPEGLGEVAMRVSVEKGKVAVQMITESDEAKKLIERSLGDLKSSLNSNHLQLDTIKVDTATNLGKQLEQQYHEAQRQQAHMQWEQFRQDQPGGWKQSFFDIASIRQPYQSDSKAPRDTQSPSAQSRSGATRRLDLVA